MSLDMADEEDGKDDYFLEMSHCVRVSFFENLEKRYA
jgi:hypothetical protein